MSSTYEVETYVKSTDATTLLTAVVEALQSEGWTYDEVTFGGYTINAEFDWAFTGVGKEREAESLEVGIQTVGDVGEGGLRLGQEISDTVVDLLVHLHHPEGLNTAPKFENESVYCISLTTDCRFVSYDEVPLLKFLETIVTLVRAIDPLVVFTGIDWNTPKITETELETAPIHITPCTYFGPTACDYLGRDKLLSAPAKLVKTIGDGILLVAGPHYFGGSSIECEEVAEHLDLKFE